MNALWKSIIIPHLLASLFFVQSIAVTDLHYKYSLAKEGGEKVKILLVPGHEPSYGGTEFKGAKERDMAVDLAAKLSELLKNDDHFSVLVARDKTSWIPDLQTFFDTHETDIAEFTQSKKIEMASLMAAGKVQAVTDGVVHNSVSKEVWTHLFGVNKWANDNQIDIVLHIHFNDNPRKIVSKAGAYKGFAIYVPEAQYSNATTTHAVAERLFSRLGTNFPVSTMPKEAGGIVEDQDLIAIGNANTVDGVSMLVEYGYIYENRFSTAAKRTATIDSLAQQTYLGIEDFFAEKQAENQ